MKYFSTLAILVLTCLLGACAATQPPKPIPHWELSPPAGYGND